MGDPVTIDITLKIQKKKIGIHSYHFIDYKDFFCYCLIY